MDLPRFVHGNEDFDASFDGVGVKLQYFLRESQDGLFVGLSTGIIRPFVELRDTDFAHRTVQYLTGLQAGWRINLGAGFYITPWVGVDYLFRLPNKESSSLRVQDVTLSGKQ